MALTHTGAEPAPELTQAILDEFGEQIRGYLAVRTFSYPNFPVTSENKVKHHYELKVTGRLADIPPGDLWDLMFQGNTVRTMIGDTVAEKQNTDHAWASKVENKIHLAVSSLLEWVTIKIGKQTRASAGAMKDSKIALLTKQNEEQNALILSLMAKIDALLAKQEQAA